MEIVVDTVEGVSEGERFKIREQPSFYAYYIMGLTSFILLNREVADSRNSQNGKSNKIQSPFFEVQTELDPRRRQVLIKLAEGFNRIVREMEMSEFLMGQVDERKLVGFKTHQRYLKMCATLELLGYYIRNPLKIPLGTNVSVNHLSPWARKVVLKCNLLQRQDQVIGVWFGYGRYSCETREFI